MATETFYLRKKDKDPDSISATKGSIRKQSIETEQNVTFSPSTEVQQPQPDITTSIVLRPSMFDDSLSDTDSVRSGSDVVWQSSLVELDNTNFDFLSTFSNAPSLDKISLESHQLHSVLTAKEEEEARPTDLGVFVDPLTGELIQREKKDDQVVDEKDIQETAEEEEERDESDETGMRFSFMEDSELLLLLEPQEKETVATAYDDEEEALEQFLTQEVRLERIPTFIIAESAYERERLHNMMIAETAKFMNRLINLVVQKVEYADPTELLRKNLDKLALMDEIEDKLEDLEVMRKIRYNLNRKVIEYHKRKNLYRAIRDESTNEFLKEMKQFKDITKNLDNALYLESELIEKTELMHSQLHAQLDDAQRKNDEKEKELETLVQQTLVRKESEKFSAIISDLLERIYTYRNEISKVLLYLIRKQHTKALLEEKIDQYERDLRIREYEVLQTVTVELAKKVEERNVELNDFRRRCNTEIHAISHLKEKTSTLRLLVSLKKKALATLIQHKKEVRENLIGLKVERKRLQNQIQELRYQSGLLCNPALMRDYDATAAQADEVRERIKYMREQRNDLINKIAKFEKKCLGKQSEEEFINVNKLKVRT